MASRALLLTGAVCLLLFACLSAVQGAECSTDEECRSATSCKTEGTVYCCPAGGRLVANGTDGTCACDAGTGLSCSGGAQLGVGSQFLPALPAKPADNDCRNGSECSSSSSCEVGETSYCCPGGRVSAVSIRGELTSCSCTYVYTGYSCTTGSSSSNLASGLTCVMAPVLAVSFRFFSQLRG